MASTLAVSATRLLRVALAGPLSANVSEALRRHAVSIVELNTATPLDAVVLLPGADADSVFARMLYDGHLLASVIDLSGADSPRADFAAPVAGPDSLARGIETAMAISEARSTIAPIPNNDDRLGLTVLALAITRQRDIEPQLNPAQASMFDYPLLAGIAAQRSILETLASAKLLKRRFFERAYLCEDCSGSRMLARDACSSCGSADLEQQTLIHHYRCGEQAPKPNFIKGDELVCPKCERVLRHFGVDYDAPGPVYFCHACRKTSPEPEARFLCGDCKATTRGIDAQTMDWYSYSPTELAHSAVAEGRLPGIGLENLLNGLPGWRTPRDFALMLDLSHRLSTRYSRPYSLLQVDAAETAEALAQFGKAGAVQMQRMMVDLVRQSVRETDFFATVDGRLLLLLPETSSDKCDVLIERLQARTAETLGQHVELVVRLNEQQVPALIEQLTK